MNLKNKQEVLFFGNDLLSPTLWKTTIEKQYLFPSLTFQDKTHVIEKLNLEEYQGVVCLIVKTN